MSVRNDNTEPEATNLELSLGFSDNCCISSRSSDQGAGVNASRVDMRYDPLSELVWSPHNGLSLKCADSSFITKSPPHIWDVGLSNFSDKGKLVASQASLIVTHKTIGSVVPLVKPNFGHFLGSSGIMDQVNNNRQESTSKNDEEGKLRENDEDLKEKKTLDFLSIRTNEPSLHEDEGSSMPNPIPVSSSPEGKKEDLTVDIETKNEPNVDYSIERLEGTAENEIPSDKNPRNTNEERLRRGKSVMIEASPAFSKVILDREKGKEKVLSKGESSKSNSKVKEDSDESVESCSNIGVFSVGQKRDRFEQQMIFGSKRAKNQIQENPVSASLMGQRSSFMNWISNMVKGLNRAEQEEEPSLALTLPNQEEEGGDNTVVLYNGTDNQRGTSDAGFRTIFRSIYCPKTEEMELDATNGNTPIRDSEQLVSADRAVSTSACAGVAGRNSSSSETRAIVGEKMVIDIENKCDNPQNLWITRFSQKSHDNLVNLGGPSGALNKIDHNSDEISSFQSMHIIPSASVKYKGVMASEFAKRIDTLKNITPSDITAETAQKMPTCLYCGKIGHNLCSCSEITETGRDYFSRNMSKYEGIKDTCFCIRCFEVDHWAVSCPKGLVFKQESHSQLGIDKGVDSTSEDDMAKGERLLEETKGIFDAVKKLRLSRTDIHKWMNSSFSLSSLEGYFLRLRLGKWEKSQGGTGYYVACIIGEGKGKEPQGSKRTILVDIGGKSCLVESRYISNQDFLEDEFTAWWSTTVKSGTLPSGDDLKAKFEERVRLGF